MHGSFGGRERLRVETGGDLVALLCRFVVAGIGAKRKPLVGLGVILLHADAARIEDCEIVLAVGDAVLGGLAEPLGGGAVIRRAVDALRVKHREIVHRFAVALCRSGRIEVACGAEIFLYADAFFIKAAEAEFRRGEALLGGKFKPVQRLFVVRRGAMPVGESRCDLEFSRSVSRHRRRAQHGSADRGRQLLGYRAGRRGRAGAMIAVAAGAADGGGDAGRRGSVPVISDGSCSADCRPGTAGGATSGEVVAGALGTALCGFSGGVAGVVSGAALGTGNTSGPDCGGSLDESVWGTTAGDDASSAGCDATAGPLSWNIWSAMRMPPARMSTAATAMMSLRLRDGVSAALPRAATRSARVARSGGAAAAACAARRAAAMKFGFSSGSAMTGGLA